MSFIISTCRYKRRNYLVVDIQKSEQTNMSSTTFLPFLYQTRTILKSPRIPVALLRSFHATSRSLKDEIPFASEVGDDSISFDSTKRGTITPTERQIFERIFADIQARGLKPNLREDGAAPSPPSASTTARSAMLIMQQAAQDAGQARPSTVTAPGLLAGAAKDRNKALLRFPPELRAAASKALNTIGPSAPGRIYGGASSADAAAVEEEEGWKAPAHTFMRKFELDAKRHPERMRVEGLITAARTDYELWEVLEKEVFTMPAKLGLDQKPEMEEEEEEEEHTTKKATSTRGRKKNKEDLEAVAASKVELQSSNAEHDSETGVEAEAETVVASETTTAESEESLDAESPVPPEKMSLYVHGPLYPAYLLLALRRLDTAFSASSPLALNMLPRIKELGLESYVLGVSTPFYNELLEIYWSRYGDLSGMLDLLEEMRHCGLYFDHQTSSILSQVQASVNKLARGGSGSSSGRGEYGLFAAAIMTMPQYERSVRERIRHWHQAVDMSIEQRGDDIGY